MKKQIDGQQWLKEFRAVLAKLKYDPRAVQDAVDVVESHCTDSAESPYQAFGDPKDYALSLPGSAKPIDWKLGLVTGLCTLPPLLTWALANPLVTGSKFDLTLGMVIFGICHTIILSVLFGRGTSRIFTNPTIGLSLLVISDSLLFALLYTALPMVVWQTQPIVIAAVIVAIWLIGPVSALPYFKKSETSARIHRENLLAISALSFTMSLVALGAGLLIPNAGG